MRADDPAQHLFEIRDNGVDVDDARVEHLAAAEGEELARQRRRALGRLLDLEQVVASPIVRREVLEEKLGVAGDRRQEIVEVVGDAAGELAHRLQPLRQVQPLLTLAQRFLGAASLGHVLIRADETDGAPFRVANHPADAVDRPRAVRPEDEKLVLEARA